MSSLFVVKTKQNTRMVSGQNADSLVAGKAGVLAEPGFHRAKCLKNKFFRDVTLCSWVNDYRRFERL
jgi:hypothetical protein